jgi:hypothetical protein
LTKVLIVIATLLVFTPVSIGHADEIPMTIDGQINCAHPVNAITTTCRGEAPPPSVNTPVVTREVPAPAAPAPPASSATPSSAETPQAPSIPLTINGEINCANPDNAITTTCWDRAQSSKISGTPDPAAVDCNLAQFKQYPVCTGEKPKAVLDYEKSREGAAQVPAANSETLEFKTVDCSVDANKESPYCLPMTINGDINCAQAANAITTTCWDQALKDKAAGRLFPNGVDCSKEFFKTYPVCTGIKPQAVVDFEKSKEGAAKTAPANTQCADPANVGSAACSPSAISEAEKKTQTEQKTDAKPAETKPAETNISEPAKPQVSGSIDLKSRSTKTTVLTLDLDTSNVKVKIVASKKGSPSITQQVVADSEGNKTVKFSKNLKGYTVKVYIDGQIVDQTKVS